MPNLAIFAKRMFAKLKQVFFVLVTHEKHLLWASVFNSFEIRSFGCESAASLSTSSSYRRAGPIIGRSLRFNIPDMDGLLTQCLSVIQVRALSCRK
jgi:hypothetical protein